MIHHTPFTVSGMLAVLLVVGTISVGSIGQKRKEALVRVLAFIWLAIIGMVYSVLTLVFFVVALVEVVWQLVTDRDGFGAGSFVSDWIRAWVYWYADMHAYIFTGEASPNWLPRREDGSR